MSDKLTNLPYTDAAFSTDVFYVVSLQDSTSGISSQITTQDLFGSINVPISSNDRLDVYNASVTNLLTLSTASISNKLTIGSTTISQVSSIFIGNLSATGDIHLPFENDLIVAGGDIIIDNVGDLSANGGNIVATGGKITSNNIGLDNSITTSYFAFAAGYLNSIAGANRGIAIGQYCASEGADAQSYGIGVYNDQPWTIELGYWDPGSYDTRHSAIKLYENGGVNMTAPVSDTTPVPSTSALPGSENQGDIMVNSIMFRVNTSNELVVDWCNSNGTVKSLTIGTLA